VSKIENGVFFRAVASCLSCSASRDLECCSLNGGGGTQRENHWVEEEEGRVGEYVWEREPDDKKAQASKLISTREMKESVCVCVSVWVWVRGGALMDETDVITGTNTRGSRDGELARREALLLMLTVNTF